MDASVIYGSDLKTQEELRSFVGGRLQMLNDFGRDMLPLTTDKSACVTLENGPCYFTGLLFALPNVFRLFITFLACVFSCS